MQKSCMKILFSYEAGNSDKLYFIKILAINVILFPSFSFVESNLKKLSKNNFHFFFVKVMYEDFNYETGNSDIFIQHISYKRNKFQCTRYFPSLYSCKHFLFLQYYTHKFISCLPSAKKPIAHLLSAQLSMHAHNFLPWCEFSSPASPFIHNPRYNIRRYLVALHSNQVRT